MAGTLKTSQFNSATVANPTDEVPLLQGGQLKRVQVKVLTGNPDVGWLATGESWTFSSFNSTTRIGVVGVPSDATVKYSVGMWVRISQTTGGTKWGMITAVSTTSLSINFFYNQTLTNEAITTPVYSPLAQPFGTPKLPVKNTDANSWVVWDFGTYKEYRRQVGWAVAWVSGESKQLINSTLPVGFSNLGGFDLDFTFTVGAYVEVHTANWQVTNTPSGVTNLSVWGRQISGSTISTNGMLSFILRQQ